MSLSLYAVSKNNFIAQSAFEALSSVARPNVDEIYNIFATNLNQVDNSLSEPLTLAEAAWMVYFSTVLLSKNEVKDTSIFAKGVLKRIAELPKPSFAQKPALFLRMLEVFNKLYKFWKEYLKS